jgi:peroxiredoxin
MKRLFVVLAIVLVALPLITACCPLGGDEPEPAFTPHPGPHVGRPAPELGWKNPDGESDKLSDHRGEIVMVVFWSPRCPHCLDELPIIQAMYDRYADEGLFVVSFAADSSDSWQVVKEELDLTFTIVVDPQVQSFGLYQILGVPAIFVIDRGGIIQVRQEGAMSRAELEELIKPLLEEE